MTDSTPGESCVIALVAPRITRHIGCRIKALLMQMRARARAIQIIMNTITDTMDLPIPFSKHFCHLLPLIDPRLDGFSFRNLDPRTFRHFRDLFNRIRPVALGYFYYKRKLGRYDMRITQPGHHFSRILAENIDFDLFAPIIPYVTRLGLKFNFAFHRLDNQVDRRSSVLIDIESAAIITFCTDPMPAAGQLEFNRVKSNFQEIGGDRLDAGQDIVFEGGCASLSLDEQRRQAVGGRKRHERHGQRGNECDGESGQLAHGASATGNRLRAIAMTGSTLLPVRLGSYPAASYSIPVAESKICTTIVSLLL